MAFSDKTIVFFTVAIIVLSVTSFVIQKHESFTAVVPGSRLFEFPDNDPGHWTTARELPDSLRYRHQSDPELIGHIHDHWILHPTNKALNLHSPHIVDFSQFGQSLYFDKLFNNKTGGFYIECGAYVGEELSNTLYFERERQWDGLLVEAIPQLFQTVLTKHRHAYTINTCLSSSEWTQTLNYTNDLGALGGIAEYNPFKINTTYIELPCIPLYSILAALGGRHIDFFSLDIEGAELQILKTIPFQDVDIDVMCIEVGEISKAQDKINDIVQYLGQYGYLHVDTLTIDIVMKKSY